MTKRLVGCAVVFAALALFLPAFAHAEPIGAKAVYVDGEVSVIGSDGVETRRVQVGSLFAEGDRVTTAADGVVEIEFDNKDMMRVGKSSSVRIRSLNRDKRGSTHSVFNLFFGRIKAAVSKLATTESRFEYHTKAAVAGVSGTPPFIVEYFDGLTSIDLLGQKGDIGSIYVIGLDADKTRVFLMPGFRTTVAEGQKPHEPFPISKERLRELNRSMPFQSKGGIAMGGGGVRMATSSIAQKVSTPIPTSPADARTPTGINNSTSTGQGVIGQDGEPTGTVVTPASMATGQINISY